MSRSESWKTWGLVFGLLIFAGIASAAWPWFSERLGGGESQSRRELETELEPITIQVEDYVLGSDLLQIPFIRENIDGLQLSQVQATGLIVAISVAALGVLGLPLALIYVRLGRQVEAMQQDELFQEAQAKLAEREQTTLKQANEGKSSAPKREGGRRTSWSVVSTSIVVTLFVWFLSLALGESFFGDATIAVGRFLFTKSTVLNWALIVITLGVLYLYFSTRKPDVLDTGETDYQPVTWGWIWVLISGLLIVGIGTGLAIAVSA